MHPVRADKDKPQYNTFQIEKLNVTFHDATYGTRQPSTQFLTLDILHGNELDALDIEETVVALLQEGGMTPLMDYSVSPAVQVSNNLVFWNPESIKFRTVASTDYFHRSAVLELFTRYA